MQYIPEKISKLVICCCADYQRVSPASVQQLYAAADQAGVAVELCPDLCLEAVKNPGFMQNISDSETVVAACYPRAVKALFNRVKCKSPLLVDLAHQTIQQILRSLDWGQAVVRPTELPKYDNSWKAWYPTIDSERCNRCGKCVDYCFFGVYQRQDKRIEVKSPQNCKNNCPACARMCPQQAIIFPKHPDSPINGGSEDPLKKAGPIDTDMSFDENLYNRLAQRRRAQRKSNLYKE